MGAKQYDTVRKNDPQYLRFFINRLQDKSDQSIKIIGRKEILDRPLLALFSSVKCPGSLIIKAYDFAQELKSEGIAVIGGFHSPIELEMLTLLLRSSTR